MKSVKKVALGGMVAALCIVLMMLTGLLPMAEFALPALAGVLLIMLVVEISPKWAFLVYLAVAILSLLLAPSKDSAVFFTAFLGWYPIAKSKLENIKKPVLEWVWKVLIFNISIGAGLAAAVYMFRLSDYVEILQDSVWMLLRLLSNPLNKAAKQYLSLLKSVPSTILVERARSFAVLLTSFGCNGRPR